MEAKETIAILGLKKGEVTLFLDQLANDNRILIVSNEINDCGGISEYLSQNKQEHEVEVIECAKEGCWEADLIVLWNPFQFKEEELLRLRAVATQKIVLLIQDQDVEYGAHPLFPNSKVVTLALNHLTKEANIYGEDLEAVNSIHKLIEKTGYLILEKTNTKK